MSPRRASLLALLLAAYGAAAQVPGEDERLAELVRPHSRVEVGAGATSNESLASGRGSGLERHYAIGAFDLRGAAWRYNNPSDDGFRWRLSGSELGLDTRALRGEYGKFNAWRISAAFEALPWRAADTYQTPYGGAGGARLTLPAGWVKGADPAALGGLAAALNRVPIERKRERGELSSVVWFDSDWEWRTTFRNEARSGTKLRGLEFGSNGGNPRSALLPEPVDSTTRVIETSLAYADEEFRAVLGWSSSFYRTADRALVWNNAYSSAPWTGGASGLPAGFALPLGQAALAPDNDAHQVSLNGAWDLSNATRMNFSATRGRMTQDAPLLPYTINAGLAATPLPRASADAQVMTTHLHARLVHRVSRTLSITGQLKFDDRDNRTPMAEYLYVGGDIQRQPLFDSATDRQRTNLPRSRSDRRAMLEADYRVMPGLNARTGWDFEETRRTFTEVARTREHTVRLDLRANRDRFSFNGGLAWLERRGSEYRYNLPYLASYSSEAFINALASASGCAILAECIRVGPLQNKFYIADRDRLRARAWAGYSEAPFSASLRLDLNRDRYPNSPYGLGESNQSVASLDAGFTPDETFSASAFVTFDRQSQASRTRQIGSVNAVSSNPLADWRVDQGNRTRTLGLNATRAALAGGRLTLSAEALWLSSRSPVTLAAGPAVNPAQNPPGALPDLRSVSTRLALEARYALSRATLLKARYQAWRQRNDDWSLEQVRAATLSNVIGTLETPLYGTTHGLGLSVVHTFR